MFEWTLEERMYRLRTGIGFAAPLVLAGAIGVTGATARSVPREPAGVRLPTPPLTDRLASLVSDQCPRTGTCASGPTD